jgi:hypothetical protein
MEKMNLEIYFVDMVEVVNLHSVELSNDMLTEMKTSKRPKLLTTLQVLTKSLTKSFC